MRVPVTQADRFYFALAAVGGAAYVYRFALPFGNVSLFRVAIVVGGILLIGRWARDGTDLVAIRVLPLLAAATIGPAIDFIRLPSDSVHRVEVSGYFLNLIGMVLMFSAVSSRAAALTAVRWFCHAATVSIVIAWYALITGEIPGEQLLRSHGSEYTKELSYLNAGDGTIRLTGPFFDPNFFGAYLVMAITCCLVMWETGRKRRWLALAAACAVSMLLTGSRTALLGLIVLVAIWGSGGLLGLGRRSLASLGALTVAVVVAGEFWDGFYDRLLNTDLTRLEFIERGWSAFSSHPLLGGSASGLEDPDSGYATAHTLYLSALGKYGILGGALLLVFIFAPLIAMLSRRTMDPLSRRLVLGVLLPLAAMYFTYDFFMFLEFQFLLFGLVYAVAFRGIRLGQDQRNGRRAATVPGKLNPAEFRRGTAGAI